MSNGIQANGTKLPWALIVGVLTFTFWLGGLSIGVGANASDLDEHKAKPSHAEVSTDVAAIKADLRNTKDAITEIKNELKEGRKQASNDKTEILNAIRAQE